MIFITGRIPPVIHFRRDCFGIIGKPKMIDIEKVTDEELNRIFSICEPCCICASEYSGDKEDRRLELKRLGDKDEIDRNNS